MQPGLAGAFAAFRLTAARDHAFGTVAVISSFFSIGLATVYWIARTGFENPAAPVLKATALSLFMINVPYLARVLSRFAPVPYTWATSHSFLWLCAVILATIAGSIARLTSLDLFPAIGTLGVALFLLTLADWVRGSQAWRSLVIVAGSLAVSVWAAGVVWGRIYKSPLFVEMLAVDGIVHHDTLGLAALANMLRTYGIASVGLDGLPYMAYHWGSPWMFAQLASLLRTDTIGFYQLGYVVAFVPFFFGGLLCFAAEIRNAWGLHLAPAAARRKIDPDLREELWLLVLPLVAAIGVIPVTGMDAMGVWTSNLMISESYAVALPVSLLLFGTAAAFWESRGRAVTSRQQRVSDWLFLLVVIPLGIIVLGFLKISFMILGALALVYASVRKGLYRQPRLMVVGIALIAGCLLTSRLVSLPQHREGLQPLDFLTGFVPPAWWPFFMLVHLFWSFAYVAMRVHAEGARTVGELKNALRDGRLVDAEVVALAALAGIAPGLLVHIDGGSAFYFSDIQRWLAVGLLMGTLGTLVSGPRFSHRGSWSRPRTLLLAFLGAPLAVSFLANSVHWTARMARANAETRHALYPESVSESIRPGLRGLPRLFDDSLLRAGVRNARNFPVIKALQQLDALPHSEKKLSALFIPQAESRYWQLLARPGACSFSGHLAPAFSSLTMVDGMPAAQCTLSRYYGLGLFTPRRGMQAEEYVSAGRLCTRASRYGLSRIITLRFDAAGVAHAQRLKCSRRT